MQRMSLEERREALVAAAIRVISAGGVADASVRAIVAEAGMPLGAFHYVFASREEMLAAVIAQVTDDERAAAWFEVELAAPRDGDVGSVFRTGLEAYLRLLETEPERELALLDLAVHAARHDPAAVRAQWDTYRAAAESSLRHVAEVLGIGWRRPVAELARSLTAAIDGLTLSWLTDRDGEAARRTAAFIAESFAAQALPPPPASRPRASRERLPHRHTLQEGTEC